MSKKSKKVRAKDKHSVVNATILQEGRSHTMAISPAFAEAAAKHALFNDAKALVDRL